MEMATDAENIAGEGIESDSAASPSSVCDGSDSLGGSQSSRRNASKKQNSSECSVGSLLDTPNDDSSNVPKVKFNKGQAESVVDHPAAVTNKALDSDDVGLKENEGKTKEVIVVDIPHQTHFEADTETSEGAVVGQGNDSMLETSF